MRKIFVISVFPFVLFSAGAFSEIGNAYYRGLGIPSWLEEAPEWFKTLWSSVAHAGIYYKWNYFGSPYSWEHQIAVYASGVKVTMTPLSQDAWTAPPFYGFRDAILTSRQRTLIDSLARTQLYVPYSLIFYKNPGAYFRCDGFVEWLYEQVGIDLVSDFGPWTIYPLLQMNSSQFVEGQAVPPLIDILSPIEGDTVSGVIKIIVYAFDYTFGSGMFGVKAFLDHLPPPIMYEEEKSPGYIGKDIHTTLVPDTFIIYFNTKKFVDGEHILYIRGYDLAGNYTDKNIIIYIQNESPCIHSHYPEHGQTNVPVNTKIRITFTKPMDVVSTEGAISISSDFPKIFEWSSDLRTVTIKPQDTLKDLKYETQYIVTINGTARYMCTL